VSEKPESKDCIKEMVAECGADGYLCKSQIMGDGVTSFLD